KQLTHKPQPPRTERAADRKLAPACGCACQQETGDVGASNQQQEAHRHHDNQERLAELLAQSCETTVSGLQFEPEILLPTRLRTVLLQTQVQFSLCLSGVNAGWYTAHEAQPGIFALL